MADNNDIISGFDEKKETDPSFSSAKQTLKDLIHITEPGDEGYENKVVEGTFDADDDVGEWQDLQDKNPVQKAVEDLTASVRGSLSTHVVPHLENVKQHSTKVLQGVQQHSDRVVKGVQENSTKALQGLQEHSIRAVQGVQEHTQRAWQATEKGTKEFHQQHVVPHVEKATAATKEFHSIHVQPKVEKALHDSTRALQTTGSCLQRTYQRIQTAIVQNRPYYWNTAPDLFDETVAPWYLVLEEGTCRAFGQVVCCNNPVSGLFILFAILLASPLAALCSISCVVMINLTGIYLDMDRKILRQGWYAYNGVLIGTSLVDYFSFDHLWGGGWSVQVLLSIFLAPVTLIVCLWLQHKVLSASTPVLLLPFNTVMILVLLSVKMWDTTMITKVDFADETVTTDAIADAAIPAERYFGYKAVLNGVARIFLVDGVAAGALMLVGIWTCSRILVLAVIGGAFLSSVLSLVVFDVPTSYLNGGFAGVNPALAMVAIFFYLKPSWKLTGLAFIGLILTMITTGAVDVVFNAIGITVSMTFGFCFALLPFLSLDLQSVFGASNTWIQRIPESELTCPEEYLEKLAPPPAMDLDEKEEDTEAGVILVTETVDVQNESTPLLSNQST